MSRKNKTYNYNPYGKEDSQKEEVQYVQPKTDGQEDLIAAISENSIVLVSGFSGTGKSHIAVSMACQYLAQQKVKKIVITRPIVAASSKTLGALPGELKEKFDPYLVPVLEIMKKYYSHTEVERFIRDKTIETVPLELMRGRTFDDAFILTDEAQNCSFEQLLMVLTRIGQNSKLVINGDTEQTDLKYDAGGFAKIMDMLDGIADIEIVEMLEEDIVRNKLIKDILKAVATRKV